MIWIWVSIGVILLGIIIIFNKMKKAENYVGDGYSNIDVFLRKRYDLIPSVVDVAKVYATTEEEVLVKVTSLRTQGTANAELSKQAEVDHRLAPLMKQIILNFEQYPNLKSDKAFLNVQTELVEIEDALERARRYYNGCVRDYNTLIQKFPNNLVTSLFGAKEKDFFKHSSI